MVRPPAWAAVLALAVAAVSGCSAASNGSSGPLLAPRSYGEPGQRFSISSGRPPVHEVLADGDVWEGGGVDVRVIALARPVAATRIGPYLRSFLSSSHGGRVITRFGLPAATGIWPCFSPAPGCQGFDGDIDVLDGLTVYDVHTSGLDRPTTEAALDSLRIGSALTRS